MKKNFNMAKKQVKKSIRYKAYRKEKDKPHLLYGNGKIMTKQLKELLNQNNK